MNDREQYTQDAPVAGAVRQADDGSWDIEITVGSVTGEVTLIRDARGQIIRSGDSLDCWMSQGLISAGADPDEVTAVARAAVLVETGR